MHMTNVSWLSHTSTNTTFLSKATDYFSHMLQQRWKAKIRQKESLPQPGIELTTTRSWVWHAFHLATQAGHLGPWIGDDSLMSSEMNTFWDKDLHFPLDWWRQLVVDQNELITWLSVTETIYYSRQQATFTNYTDRLSFKLVQVGVDNKWQKRRWRIRWRLHRHTQIIQKRRWQQDQHILSFAKQLILSAQQAKRQHRMCSVSLDLYPATLFNPFQNDKF